MLVFNDVVLEFSNVKLKECRKQKKMTQKELGEKSHINEVQIRRYELGKVKPKIQTLEKIADALEVPIVDLLDEKVEKNIIGLRGNNMTTGENIRYYRKRNGLTQKQLGELCGMSASYIAQYENDLRSPKLETLKKIADALGVSIVDLLDEKVEKNIIGLRGNNMTTGENIRYYRKRNGLTQKELSQLSGVHEITIANYESGKYTNPKYSNVKKLADALGVNIGDIAGQEYAIEPLFNDEEIDVIVHCLELAKSVCSLSESYTMVGMIQGIRNKIEEYYK